MRFEHVTATQTLQQKQLYFAIKSTMGKVGVDAPLFKSIHIFLNVLKVMLLSNNKSIEWGFFGLI